MGLLQSKINIRDQIRNELSLLSDETDKTIQSLKNDITNQESKNTHTINKLTDENEYLKTINNTLEKEISVLKSNISSDGGLSLTNLSTSELRIISEKNVDVIIDKILSNPDTNIKWMPDVVEKKIYKNIAMIALNAFETTIENSGIHFLGQRIKFVMDPIIPEPVKVNES
mgnify:FL=1|jgi:hypothetical protein